MRVAYVCADPGVPVYGAKGASVHVQAVAGSLARRGARVQLLATRWGGERPPALQGVREHRLPPAPKGDAAVRERRALAANTALAHALEDLGALDLVIERYSLWSHAAMEHARRAGVPCVLEVNAPLIDEQAAHRALVHRQEAEQATARVLAAAGTIVAVSEGVAEWLQRWPQARGRVHVVANGVDPARFPAHLAAPRRRRRGESFTVGFLGTLKPWHGLDTLVAAFCALRRTHPEARLRVVGDGPQGPSLRRALAEHGALDAAELVGGVDPAQVAEQLAAMDVAVAPYPDLRPFYFSPLKVFEAMAAGLPVVASRVGQLEQLVDEGTSGLLYPPGEAAALAGALARLADDPTGCRRMGANARRAVLATHTWDAVTDRVLALAGVGTAPVTGRAA